MDAITGLRPATTTAPGARTMPARSGFSVPGGGATGAAAASAPLSMAGLLALQEAGGEEERDRHAKRRGRDLLDELAGLQRDLLGGAVDPARLARLSALLTDLPAATDPGLRDVVKAIALRARVEAARYGRA